MHHPTTQYEESSWPSDRQEMFGQESIEMTTDDIYNQSDLAEQIEEAERRFSTSSITTSYFSSERFEYPATYRVLFMGAADGAIKGRLLEKLGQGFVHVLLGQQRAWGQEAMIPFREVKHNLVPLNNYYVEKNISSASYEEYGVSMIEADFTWHSTAAECSSDANQLLLQYAWKQCPNPSELPSAHLGHDLPEAFEGFMCPEKTPNGIDLCVYVYEKEDEERTRADMALLHKIRKLGIYVLPLTTQRLESIKSHFARVLNDHQVRCLDLSNIQIGQPPLFQYKSDRLSRIQGMECRQLEVASYQILSVDQFCAIENTNILELLKRTRDREVERDETKRQDYNQLLNLAPLPEIRTGPDICPDPPGVSPVMWILMALGLLWALVWIQTRPPAPWTARFQLDPKLLLVVIQNPDGIPAWPEIEPIVWLNDQHQIPLQKTDRSGAYQLTMRMMPTLFQSQKSYTFHVNTTDPHSIFVDSRTTLYVTAAVETQPNPPQPEPTPSPLPTPKEPVEGVYQAAIDRVLFYSEHLKYLRRRIFTG